MDHRGLRRGATPTTVESTDLGMAGRRGPWSGGAAHMTSGTFHDQLGAAAARGASFDGFEPIAAAYHNSAEFAHHVRVAVPVAVFHREPGPGVVVYANIGVSWQQPGPLAVVAQNSRNESPRCMTAHSTRAGAAAPSGCWTRRGAMCRGVGHGEVFVGMLSGGGVAEQVDYVYYAWQPCPGAGSGEVFIGPLPDGVGAAFVNSGNFAQQTVAGTKRADGNAGTLRGRNLGAAYNNPGMVAEHLRRLLFAGIGTCSVAVIEWARRGTGFVGCCL